MILLGEDQDIGSLYPTVEWAKTYHQNTRGEPMQFLGMPYLFELYKCINKSPKMVVEKSVQCGLSELFIIQSHLEAASGLTVMYVLPKYESRNRFVNNRIHKLHRRVEHYKSLVKTASGSHRTSLMHFGKGTIAFVGSNVESEFIEMPVDSAFVDEKDRCNLSNLLLLPDRLTASPYKYQREISNPTVEGFGIDERYLESSQGQWMIKCNSCGEYFTPDFFKHVVRQIDTRVYEPRDPEYEEGKGMRLIHDCGAAVDRLKEGEWVHTYPEKEWQGYRISKLYMKYSRLNGLYKSWMDATGNELKKQVFYNSDLGLPYTAKGAKITRSDLQRCCRDYSWPVSRSSNVKVMGVDVGADLTVVVRDVCKDGDAQKLRLLYAGRVPSFAMLGDLIEKWNPKIVVIDAYPEIHKVMELKGEFRQVYSSRFQEGHRKIIVDKKSREITMDRTAILDYVKQAIDEEMYILPLNAEFLDEGQYFDQMTASTRILETDEKNLEKSRFVWVHTKDDHYFLAEAYCMQAFQLIPDHSVLSFFEDSIKEMKSPLQGSGEVGKMSPEELKRMSPPMFLERMRRFNGRF